MSIFFSTSRNIIFYVFAFVTDETKEPVSTKPRRWYSLDSLRQSSQHEERDSASGNNFFYFILMQKALIKFQFQLKILRQNVQLNLFDMIGSRSPSPAPSSGVESSSIKDSPLQLDLASDGGNVGKYFKYWTFYYFFDLSCRHKNFIKATIGLSQGKHYRGCDSREKAG